MRKKLLILLVFILIFTTAIFAFSGCAKKQNDFVKATNSVYNMFNLSGNGIKFVGAVIGNDFSITAQYFMATNEEFDAAQEIIKEKADDINNAALSPKDKANNKKVVELRQVSGQENGVSFSLYCPKIENLNNSAIKTTSLAEFLKSSQYTDNPLYFDMDKNLTNISGAKRMNKLTVITISYFSYGVLKVEGNIIAYNPITNANSSSVTDAQKAGYISFEDNGEVNFIKTQSVNLVVQPKERLVFLTVIIVIVSLMIVFAFVFILLLKFNVIKINKGNR